MEKIVFRHQEIETLPQPQLKELQRQKLQKTVEAALKTPFYKKRLNDAGIRDARDIQTEADFRKIPYTTKHDLREAFPYGMLALKRHNRRSDGCLPDASRFGQSGGIERPFVRLHRQYKK